MVIMMIIDNYDDDHDHALGGGLAISDNDHHDGKDDDKQISVRLYLTPETDFNGFILNA